jgi:hypothetical protein
LEDERKIGLGASVSLFLFSGLTTVALFAWFARAEDPWTWRAVVTFLSALLGVVMGALTLRAPSRTTCWAGAAVMMVSLVRIGPPDDWTWVSFTLLMVTFLLMIPLVHAALVLR